MSMGTVQYEEREQEKVNVDKEGPDMVLPCPRIPCSRQGMDMGHESMQS